MRNSAARPAVGANALEALQRVLARDLGMVRDERRVADVRDNELVLQPLGIREPERLAVGFDPRGLRRVSRLAQNSSAAGEPTRQTTV